MEAFAQIKQLNEIHQEQETLAKREKELSTPKLTDLELIPTIFKWFCELLKENKSKKKDYQTEKYQKFIFIILFLYTPNTLAGGKIRRGVRDKLAEVLGYKSPTAISNFSSSIMFVYKTYDEYQADINRVYAGIAVLLEQKEETELIKAEHLP